MKVNSQGSSVFPGQVYTASLDSVTDWANYKSLYQNYRIKKLEWIFVPRWGAAEPNQAEANLGNNGPYDYGVTTHFRRCWANNQGAPANEANMLVYNGVKTVTLNKLPVMRVHMSNPIVQEYIETNVNGTTTLMNPVKNRWCSFDDPTPPQHGCLVTYSAAPAGTGFFTTPGLSIASVYCKIYFEVSSPR